MFASTPENRKSVRAQIQRFTKPTHTATAVQDVTSPSIRTPASLGQAMSGAGDDSAPNEPKDAQGLVSHGWLGPDPYSKHPVMSFDESPRDSSGQFDRLRVVKTEGKYPYLRIVEKWIAGRDGDQVLDRKVMVADHVLVKLMPSATEAQLAALAKSKGGYIERRVSEEGRAYLIGFQAYDVSALDQMIAELSSSALVSQPEPDFVVTR